MSANRNLSAALEDTRTNLSGIFKKSRKGGARAAGEVSSSSSERGDPSASKTSLLDQSTSGDASSTAKGRHGRRRSVFLPGRRRKKREAEAHEREQQEEQRRQSIQSQNAGREEDGGDEDDGDADNASLSRSLASSMVTEDEDAETPKIATRESHAGYLTLSSPLIRSHPVGSTTSLPGADHDPSADSLAPRKSQTLGLPPSKPRSSSPSRKLKEAFAPRKSSTLGITDSESSVSGGSSGGGRFGAKKKSRTSLRNAAGNQDGGVSPDDNESISSRPSTARTTASAKAAPGRIDTDVPPLPLTPPNLGRAPTTLITPPTPTEARDSLSDRRPIISSATASKSVDALPSESSTSPNAAGPSGSMIAHRRARSVTNPPSKLSNSISAPLTPTLEETKTPGGTVASPSSGGFFSSVFSAAQNATNSLSSTIANPSFFGQKTKPSKEVADLPEQPVASEDGGEEVIRARSESDNEGAEKRELAVETLGSGELSLSHLGITESSDISPMGSKLELTDTVQVPSAAHKDAVEALAEDHAAAKAVSAAYRDKSKTSPSSPRPLDGARSPAIGSGEQTPPRIGAPLDGDLGGMRRQGSVRSKLSGGPRRRRKRGSSGTSGGAIAAAIGASNAALANPSANAPGGGGGPRLTGFAVASSKRNREFHHTFRSVPEDDYLIEDYSAALQRDILLHGRFYVSEGHVCFSSNILGWVTNLVISFDEVVSIEKKSTAVIFPNAIVIQTLHARNVFASFVSRDSTYDLLIGIWKISHPNLKSSVNGVALDAGTGDRTEKAESVMTDDATLDESDEDEDGAAGDEDEDEDVYDEDADEDAGEDDAGASGADGADGGVAAMDMLDAGKTVSRQTSTPALGLQTSQAQTTAAVTKALESPEAVHAGSSASVDFPGPTTHAPTECGDADTHYDRPLMDTVIAAPLGKIYSLMFGPASTTFMKRWLVEDQKSLELELPDDPDGRGMLGEARRSSSYSFIKPLYGSFGPRQTRCQIAQTLTQFDLDQAVCVDVATQNPDVPSGNVFVVKTRYCLMWAPGNGTRLIMTCTIEWSGRSFIKGAIEKGTNDGQGAYARDLVAALRAAVSKPAAAAARIRVNAKAAGGKRSRRAREAASADAAANAAASAANAAASAPRGGPASVASRHWGLLEPVHALLGPVLDPLLALLDGRVATLLVPALLGALAAWWWTRVPASAVVGGGYGYGGFAPQAGMLPPGSPLRAAAYEEIWRAEEAALWDWLEARVGSPVPGAQSGRSAGEEGRKGKAARTREGTAELDEAIRVTEEKLKRLKRAIGKEDGREEGTERRGRPTEKVKPADGGHDPTEMEREGGVW